MKKFIFLFIFYFLIEFNYINFSSNPYLFPYTEKYNPEKLKEEKLKEEKLKEEKLKEEKLKKDEFNKFFDKLEKQANKLEKDFRITKEIQKNNIHPDNKEWLSIIKNKVEKEVEKEMKEKKIRNDNKKKEEDFKKNHEKIIDKMLKEKEKEKEENEKKLETISFINNINEFTKLNNEEEKYRKLQIKKKVELEEEKKIKEELKEKQKLLEQIKLIDNVQEVFQKQMDSKDKNLKILTGTALATAGTAAGIYYRDNIKKYYKNHIKKSNKIKNDNKTNSLTHPYNLTKYTSNIKKIENQIQEKKAKAIADEKHFSQIDDAKALKELREQKYLLEAPEIATRRNQNQILEKEKFNKDEQLKMQKLNEEKKLNQQSINDITKNKHIEIKTIKDFSTIINNAKALEESRNALETLKEKKLASSSNRLEKPLQNSNLSIIMKKHETDIDNKDKSQIKNSVANESQFLKQEVIKNEKYLSQIDDAKVLKELKEQKYLLEAPGIATRRNQNQILEKEKFNKDEQLKMQKLNEEKKLNQQSINDITKNKHIEIKTIKDFSIINNAKALEESRNALETLKEKKLASSSNRLEKPLQNSNLSIIMKKNETDIDNKDKSQMKNSVAKNFLQENITIKEEIENEKKFKKDQLKEKETELKKYQKKINNENKKPDWIEKDYQRKIEKNLERKKIELQTNQNIENPIKLDELPKMQNKWRFSENFKKNLKYVIERPEKIVITAIGAIGIIGGIYYFVDKYTGKPIRQLENKEMQKVKNEIKSNNKENNFNSEIDKKEKSGWSNKDKALGTITGLGLIGGFYDWYKQSQKEDYKGFRDYSKKVYSRIKNKIKKIFN